MGYLTEPHQREHCTSSGWRYVLFQPSGIPEMGYLTEPHQRVHCTGSWWRFVLLQPAGIPEMGYLTITSSESYIVLALDGGLYYYNPLAYPRWDTSHNLIREYSVLALDGGMYHLYLLTIPQMGYLTLSLDRGIIFIRLVDICLPNFEQKYAVDEPIEIYKT